MTVRRSKPFSRTPGERASPKKVFCSSSSWLRYVKILEIAGGRGGNEGEKLCVRSWKISVRGR